ncbi:thiamine phosphate synthase [Lactobacillus sp. ESL0701]|uniref:thiamine phosphate synthase n=1 Tax=Lactobacillus sp. ESL0701 TaxID=2983217 RepID=UPI0023F76619|nr:thiamine phosphate synthase [Lactobacillus sp. ESL0701]MDF7671762.1 thiamine phosphate synthase [Lactobacillus sp. ESL0701]
MQKFNANMLRAYFICGTQDLPAGKTLPEIVEEALQAGITAFQFRDKGTGSTLSSSERLPMAQRLHELCQQYQVPFFIDDDVALAKAVNAEGIHVGQSDEAIQQVINEVGSQMIVGYSCSTLAEIKTGDQLAGIDYYGSGPIFTTQSKADADPEIGLAGLTNLVTSSKRPIVAIGGITVNDLPDIAKTGASGASVISMIAQSSNIKSTVKAMLDVPWQN